MLKAATISTRAPRGTKPVSLAFFTALDAVPEASRAAVAKAAQAMIRDELKLRRDKMKAAAAKEKARKTAASADESHAKPATRGKGAKKPVVNGEIEAPKRRGRKPAREVSGE